MSKILGRYLTPHPPIIIPEIGQGEENKVKDTVNSMKEIAEDIKSKGPKTIVIITPHGPVFKDAIAISDVEKIHGDFSKFGNASVEINKDINTVLTKKIIEDTLNKDISVVPINDDSKNNYGIELELDHGALVPLYYIDKEYSDYDLVHITYGILSKSDLYKVGIVIRSAIDKLDGEAVIIASGDLSHKLKDTGPYEYNENGPIFDKKLLGLLEDGDTKGVFNMDSEVVEQAGECGLKSLYILLGTLDKFTFNGELLSYEGTFGVGYGAMKINELKDSESLLQDIKDIENKAKIDRKKTTSPYVNLAYDSIEYFLKHEDYIEVPSDLPEVMLKEKRGTFVTYKMDGELRGCIGTILPTTGSIAKEIIRNSVEAGTRDPRFHPINLEELPFLELSVDELMEPEKATFEQLDPENYGVIVRTNSKSGLLLPDLEGVDTSEEQLSIALSKAGITPEEDYDIERFKVVRHR